MDDTTLAYIRNHLKANEGVVPYPYLDSKNLITTGTGFNVDNKTVFAQQPLRVRSADGTTQPASPAQVNDAYTAMTNEKNGTAGRPAAAFPNSTNLVLPDAGNDAQLDAKIAQNSNGVIKDIGSDAWNNLTDGQKAVMVDVRYAKGSLNNFSELKKKAIAGNALGIADESQFKSGDNADGSPRYNWDRVSRNRAAAQGIPFEDAQRQVADQFKDNPNLSGSYKSMVSPPAKPQADNAADGSTNLADDGTPNGAATTNPPADRRRGRGSRWRPLRQHHREGQGQGVRKKPRSFQTGASLRQTVIATINRPPSPAAEWQRC